MDSIWVIIILVVLSGLSSWLQKRRQGAEEGSQPTQELPPLPLPRQSRPGQPASPTAPSSPRPTTSRWEEELRRLLEGETGGMPSPPPLPPARPAPETPPRLPAAPRPSAAPRPPVAPRPVVRRPAPAPAAAPRPVSVPIPQTEAPSMVAMEAAASQMARLQQSAQAYGRASQLHEAAAERLHRVEQQTILHRTAAAAVQHRARPPEIASAVALLGNPRSARQAIVASVVLGSPKGFE